MPKISLKVEPAKYFLSIDDHPRVEISRAAAASMKARLTGGRYPLRSCPVRIEFLRRSGTTSPATPMMRMLGSGGGRGGDVRLKLYLSMIWASPGGDHDTDFQASDWAQLLGLPKYSTNGKRRVLDAIAWLEAEKFVRVRRNAGGPSDITLLHESGDESKYNVPSKGAPTGGEPTYRNLQAEWWLSGWMAGLSGRAVALWLILLDELSADSASQPIWLAESVTTNRYAFSPHMRQEAMRELADHGLIWRVRKMRQEAFKVKSSRTEITLHPDRLEEPPTFR